MNRCLLLFVALPVFFLPFFSASAATTPGIEGEFVSVPGGTFEMGDMFGDGDEDEKPVHIVSIRPFLIGKTEVTQRLWQAVMGSNPSELKGDDLPVEQVSWDDVQLFLAKLNKKTGKRFRLPTEAEWEYAARSGGKRERYAGANSYEEVAWYSNNSGNRTHPVGGKKPNGLGIFDMSGNVWEWCADWYGPYREGKVKNPTGPAEGANRVYRGGGFSSGGRNARCANRYEFPPGARGNYLGFRLARDRK